MKELLIASTNPAKIEEYAVLLRDFDVQLRSLRDIRIVEQAPENAETFLDNAREKAAFYFSRAGIATWADDGGLEVDALDGAPGVRSHRWLGVTDPTDRALAEAVIDRMKGVPTERRTARIKTAAALIYREQGRAREAAAEAALEGLIAENCYREIRRGFPYRSVLFLPDRDCYLAELSDEEAARISQRRILVEKFSPELARLP